MKKNLLTLLSFLVTLGLQAQVYTDYIGAGHDEGVVVTSSSSVDQATGDKTISGDGMDADLMEASRFLSQTTLGFDRSMIETMATTGYEAWVDAQMALPASNMLTTMEDVWDEVLALHIANGELEEDVFGPYQLHFHYAWWTLNMTNDDLLRQRVALALSEILVLSNNSDLRDRAEAVSSYYDVLINNAFGNYEDLLMEVTLHPSMGYYLSHLNNPKADLANNIHPDENYAREIMQLFSIGLYELNLDGSYVLDGNGDPIPTYDNDDIKQFAKIFTGLGPGDINDMVDWTNEPYFGLGLYGALMTTPMVMYQDFHETESKTLLNGFVVPANQDGMTDIEQTVNHLFNHPNVGPFLALRLIQRLITSNPTPGYISRVAAVFNDNGSGVRGDMGAMIKAIIMDDEARTCAAMLNPNHGKLKEPIVRAMQIAKSVPHDSPMGRYWNNGYDLSDQLKQFPMDAPSVFNFFQFDNTTVGPIADAGLVAPEFKIHNTTTSIQYINKVNQWVVWESLWWSWHGGLGDPNVEINTLDLRDMAENPEEMINYFDILYCHGQMTDETREIIRENAVQLVWGDYLYDRTRLIMYLMLLSPDYVVMK